MIRTNYKVEVKNPSTKTIKKYLLVSAYSKKEARELAKIIYQFNPDYTQTLGKAIIDLE